MKRTVPNYLEQSQAAEEVFRAVVQRALDHPPDGYETDLERSCLAGGDVSIVYRRKA